LAAAVLSRDSAMSGLARVTLPPQLAKAFAAAVDEHARQDLKKQSDDTARQLGENLLKAALPTLEAGEIDLAFDLRGPSQKGIYTLVAAGAVKKGKDVEKSLRDIARSLPEDAKKRVKLDADSQGGAAIHSIDMSADENFRRVLGE